MKNGLAKLCIAFALLMLIALATGCGTTLSANSGDGKSLNTGALNDIKGQIGAEIGGHYPDNYGLSRVYGTVTNGSKQNLKSVSFTINFGKKGQGSKVGEVEIKDLPAGEKKSFDVATSVNASTSGEYDIQISGATK